MKNVSTVFGLSNRKDAVVMYWSGKDHSGGSLLSTLKDPSMLDQKPLSYFLFCPSFSRKALPEPQSTLKFLQSYHGYFALVSKFQLAGLTKKQKNQKLL